MAHDAQALAAVGHFLQNTLSPDPATRKEAEGYLASMEGNAVTLSGGGLV